MSQMLVGDDVHKLAGHDDDLADRLALEHGHGGQRRLSVSSLEASAATVAWPRTLPMTWTTISTVSATASAGSNVGHGSL